MEFKQQNTEKEGKKDKKRAKKVHLGSHNNQS